MSRVTRNSALDVDLIATFGAVGDDASAVADSQALVDFNTWAREQTRTVRLRIPPGNYILKGTVGAANVGLFMAGVKRLVIDAYGATLRPENPAVSCIWIGGRAAYEDNLHSARVATVGRGATSVILVTLADYAMFSVGSWVLLAGIDQQGWGWPFNSSVYEYKKISAINAGTGEITFSTVVRNRYASTWPLYNAGNSFTGDLGGPATLYVIHPEFDTELHLRGLRILQTSSSFGAGRSVVLEDVIFDGGGDPAAHGPAPSVGISYHCIRCSLGVVEVDKALEYLALEDCTAKNVQFQSAVEMAIIKGGRIEALNGTAKHTSINDASIDVLNFGPTFYGVAKTLRIENSFVGAKTGTSINAQLISEFVISQGTLRINNAAGPVIWAVPGARMFIQSTEEARNYGVPFIVIAIRQDATYTYIDTTLPDPLPSIITGTKFGKHPCESVIVHSGYGCPEIVDMSNAPDGLPLNSYSRRIYTGNWGTSVFVPQWGVPAPFKVNVIRAYSGALPTLTVHFAGPFGCDVVYPDYTVDKWDPVVNLKIAGERVVLPGSVTGVQSGDVLSAPGIIWLVAGYSPALSDDISGDTQDEWPIVEIEAITDQGITKSSVLLSGTVYL